ncbi:MAG TPA: Ig-like domain-containing protein [Polyangia bacterium]|jgi:MYXO-CTERM domain-containing protein
MAIVAMGALALASCGGPPEAIDPNSVATSQSALGETADIGVTITDNVTTVGYGQPAVYTIKVTNAGPSTTGATVTNILPALLTGATWTCAPAGGASCAASGSGSINLLAVTLPSGSSVTFTMSTTIGAGVTLGSIIDLVTVATTGGVIDANITNNTAIDTDTVTLIRTMNLTKVGFSGGSVTSLLPLVACGVTCSSASTIALDGTSITLTASATAGGTFTGWGGDCASSGTSSTCTLLMTADRNVIANFTPPPGISADSGNGQTASVSTAFAAPLVARVLDSNSNPVSGVTVTFAAPSLGASAVLGATTAVTNATGRASVTAAANAVLGSYVVTATVAGGSSPASFSLVNQGAAASVNATAGGSQTTAVGTAFSSPLTVTVRDLLTNPLSGIMVSFAATLGGVTLSAPSAITNSSGQASITATAGNVSGVFAVTASVAGVILPAGFVLTAVPGPAMALSIGGGSSQSTTVATTFGTPLQVIAWDLWGNTVTGAPITFGVPASGASASLSAGSLTTGSTGAASVTATAGTIAGSYSVTASTPGVPSVSFALRNLAGAAANLIMSGGGSQSTPVLTAFSAPLVAAVTDSFGNAVAGSTVIFTAPTSGASATFSGSSAMTNAAGLASVTATANATAGSYIVVASNDTGFTSSSFAAAPLTTSVSFPLTNNASSSAGLTISGGNGQTATVATAFTAPLSATVTDSHGNPVSGVTVTFTAPGSGASATLGSPTASTNSSGVASTTVTANATSGSYVVTASAPGASSVSFLLTNRAGAAATLTISGGSGQTTSVSTAFAAPLSATVTDSHGNAVAGAMVTFAAPGSGASASLGGASAVTNSAGLASTTATANASAGSYVVTATTTGVTSGAFSLTNTAGAASNLSASGGTGQSTAILTAFSAPLSATVTDGSGNPVAGVTVTFLVPSSGASATLGSASVVTNASGVASTTATANGAAGAYVVNASAAGVMLPVSFSLTNSAAGAATLTVSGGSGQTATVSMAFGTPLSATLTDSHGNPVAGVTVTFTAPGSGASASLSSATASTNASGVASITATANATAGSYAVTASASALSPGSFSLTNAAATTNTLTASGGSGQTAAVATTFATALSATVADSNGAGVPGVTVTFVVPGSGASATLGAASATTSASGVATTTVTANGIAGSYVVTATATGVVSSVSYALTNRAGTAATLTVSGGTGQSTTVSTAFAAPLTATIADSHGNPVPGVTVTFAAPGSGAAATLGAAAVTTDAAGVASTMATANATAGSYAVTASSAGLSPGSYALTNTSGGASALAISGGSGQSTTVATAFAAPLTVAITDSHGNPVSGVAVTFAAPTVGASASLGSASTTTDSSGIASTTATANAVAGSYIVTASASGVASSVSFSLTNRSSTPAAIVVAGGNSQATTVSTPFGASLIAVVTDASGNPVPGALVTFAAPTSGASATVGTPSATTNAAGAATTTVTANALSGPYAVTASVVGAITSASFSLVNQAVLALAPSMVTVGPRATVMFTAAGGSGTGYVFSMASAPSGGSVVAGTGLYTAGATANAHDIVSLVDSLGHTATADVHVGPSLTLSLSAPQVAPGGTDMVIVSGGTSTGLVFSVTTNHSGGSIDGSGTFTAGPTGGVTDVVSVTDSVGNGASINLPITAGLSLVAASSHVPPRGSTTLTAAGGAGTGYTFALVTSASGGSVDPMTGVYHAGTVPAVVDGVRVTDGNGNSATANISVGNGVTMTPASPSLAPRDTVTFTPSGGSGSGYTFAITTNVSGGSIDATSGAYVAGARSASTDVVTVTDSLGNSATASVSVGGGLSVSPSSVTVPPRASRTFAATGGSGTGYAFSLSTNASGATINASSGVYLAGAVGAVSDVVRVVDSLGNSTSAPVTVGPGVSMSPPASTVSPLGQLTWSVAGGSGSGYTFVLSTNASGATVNSATGAYVAGATGNVSDVVAVTDSLGNSAMASVTVTGGLAVDPLQGSAISLPPRGTRMLAVVGGAPPYAFAITSNGSGGSVDSATGRYVAGSVPLRTDIVTVTDGNSATVNILVSVGAGVSLSPTLPAAAVHGTIAFTASGGSQTGYHFAISSNGSGGTIDADSGAYRAGGTDDVSDIVTVTDSLGNSASVQVPVGGRLAVSPAAPMVPPRGTITLQPYGGSGMGFVFSLAEAASGGAIDAASGVYTAGPTPNVSDMVTVTDSLGNMVTVAVMVGAGVTISPTTTNLSPLGTVSFSVAGGSGAGFVFALADSPSGGSIAANGAYTAGATGDVTDVVSVTDSLGNTASAAVSVGDPVSIHAPASTVPPLGSVMFTPAGGMGGGYTFVLRRNSSGGSIVSTTGAYTAGATPNVEDIVEVSDALGNRATLAITVGPGVSVTPVAPAVAPGGAVTFVASGGSGTGFVFAMAVNASGATIGAATGQYVAGSTTDMVDEVRVTDSLGNSILVDVAVGDSLIVSPQSAMVPPRGTVQLHANGGGGSSATYQYAVTTNASGATISAAGLYTAGAKPNVGDIVTVINSGGHGVAVHITVGDGVHLSPAVATVAAMDELTFSVSGGSGTGYRFSLATNASGGSIDALTGDYLAGTAGGNDLVSVIDSLGNQATSTVTVGVTAPLTLTLPADFTAVAPRGILQLTASGGVAPLTFGISTNASGGTINATSGVYNAGSTPSVIDVVTVQDATGVTASVQVRVGPAVTVTPAESNVAPTGTLSLTASGGSNKGFTWSFLVKASGGTLNATTGAYVAGASEGTDVLHVVDSLGNEAYATVHVIAITQGPGVDLIAGGGGCSVTGSPNGTGMGLALLVLAGLVVGARRRRTPGVHGVRRRWLVAVLVAGGGVLGAGGEARAQTKGLALDRLALSAPTSDWFVLDGLDLRGHLRLGVGLTETWADRPLVLWRTSGGVQDVIVANQTTARAGISLVVKSRFRFSLIMPVQLYANGDPASAGSVTYPPPAHAVALGDLRFDATVRLFGTYGGLATAAAGVGVIVPTGDVSSYAGAGTTRITMHAAFAGQRGLLQYAFRTAATISKDATFAATSLGSDLLFGVAAGVRVDHDRLLIGPEIFGRSTLIDNQFLDSRSTPVEGMMGAHYSLSESWRIGLGVSRGFTNGIGSPRVRTAFALQWAPPPRVADRDHDDVPDGEDACPDQPGVASSPAGRGCPVPVVAEEVVPLDSDGDGVLDRTDACPDKPGPRSPEPERNGCPLPTDTDGDGVADAVDACPDKIGVVADDPARNGCPAIYDEDGDGVIDEADACPKVAGVATLDPRTNGCPADPDRDHDGIANESDACPDDVGPASPDPKRNGCPLAFISQSQIKILDQIRFRTASDAIVKTENGDQVLAAVLDILTTHKEIKKVLVEGHTDSVGNADRNRILSAGRAAAVVKWLVDHGIDRDRLSDEGFGPDRPIDSNTTREGRRNNRRVEFHIQDDGSAVPAPPVVPAP